MMFTFAFLTTKWNQTRKVNFVEENKNKIEDKFVSVRSCINYPLNIVLSSKEERNNDETIVNPKSRWKLICVKSQCNDWINKNSVEKSLNWIHEQIMTNMWQYLHFSFAMTPWKFRVIHQSLTSYDDCHLYEHSTIDDINSLSQWKMVTECRRRRCYIWDMQ